MASEDDPEPSKMVKLESTSSFDGKYYNFEVKRPIDPLNGKTSKRRLDEEEGVAEYNQILPIGTPFDMEWAESESTSALDEHSMYGIFKMTLPKGGGPGKVTTYNDRYLTHGIIMWVAWFIFGLLMICTNRWFPHLTNKMNYLHAAFGWLIVAANLYAALDIISLNEIKEFGLHN